MIEGVQFIEHVQGNRMIDPGWLEYGPVFKNRYQAMKWAKRYKPNALAVSYQKVKIYDSLTEWEDNELSNTIG